MLVNVSKALEIPGWTSEKELVWLAEQAARRMCIVEVGCWKGRSTRALADNTRGLVYAVDTWKGTEADGHLKELEGKPTGWLLKMFLDHMADNVVPLPVPSVLAPPIVQKLNYKVDMVFIDGAHDYESVKADIAAWLPLLAPGGLFCGHDYDGGRPGVVRAVREAFPKHHVAAGSIWVAE